MKYFIVHDEEKVVMLQYFRGAKYKFLPSPPYQLIFFLVFAQKKKKKSFFSYHILTKNRLTIIHTESIIKLKRGFQKYEKNMF